MIFGAPGGHPNYVCEPSTVCVKNLPSIFDTSVFTDWENMNWSISYKLGDAAIHRYDLPELPLGHQSQGGGGGAE